jgi:autotransporter-associated beta strand protein
VEGPFTGAGSVVTLNPDRHNARCSLLYLKGGPGEFSGSIGTNVYVYVREGIVDFTGTANRYNGGLVVSGFKDDDTGKGVLGFAKFGDSGSDPSSLGLRGTVTLGEAYGLESTPLSGAFRYLGTTGESVTGKYINFGYTQDAPATFDAGAHGGLSFGSGVQWAVSEAHNQRFCLTGSNTVECAFAGKFVEGANGSVYLIKKGSGTWHLKNNAASELSGPVRIEGGVLRHDSLESRGVLCALGTAANLHDGSYVESASATPVDYSILFAGSGTGLLEYTGAYDACSSNRQVAVKTSGGFSSAVGAERIHGISAYDEAGTATLVILATNNAISTYADITDGTHGGKLGVTKRGAGTAEIDRELSFSGPLNVEGGKLIVRNSSGAYTWFRLTVKENWGVRYGGATTDEDKNHVVVERFALYDANGVRQNVGLSRHNGNLQVGGYKSTGHVVKSAASGLRPGEIGLDRPGSVNTWLTNNREIQNMCDASNSSLVGSYVRYDGGTALSPSEPDSWVKYVMRLTNGTPEIASFDIAGRFDSNLTNGNQYRQPTMWSVEGSVDGVNWDVLTNMSWDASIVGTKWYSDMSTSCYNTLSGRRWQDGKSFPIRGTPETPASFNVLGNCKSVSVAPGAVLEKQGASPVTISSLSVSTSGFGRIEGFAFAESGTIEVTGIDSFREAVEIPGEFVGVTGLDNLSGRRWRVSVNGKDKYAVAKATASGLTVIPNGFVLVYR